MLNVLRKSYKLDLSVIILFLLTNLLLSIPAGYERGEFAEVLFLTSFIQSIPVSFAVGVLFPHFKKTCFVILLFLTILFLVETFCFIWLESRLNANIWLLVFQTNFDEARDFATANLCNGPVGTYVVSSLGCVVLIYRYLLGTFRTIASIKRGYVLVVGIFQIPLLFLSSCPLPVSYGNSTILELYKSFSFLKDAQSDVSGIHKMIDMVDVYEVRDTVSALVLVIGESHCKYHSSLYGYPIKTNPLLEVEQQAGRLVAFDNVVSPTNITYPAMRFLFSHKGCGDLVSDTANVLMPVVFKKAGYDIVYLDNQYTRKKCGVFDIECGYFLNTPEVHDFCFDYRNTRTYQYDGDFVTKEKQNLKRTPMSLTIFHLQGQHANASDRYPKEFCRLTADDIKRTDLDNDERQLIAEYDNSIIYNDYVLNQIISEYADQSAVLVYVSDHGETVFDNGIRSYGRGPGNQDEARVKNEFHVPMFIWVSDRFKTVNGDVVNRIMESSSRTFCSADVPFLLYDIVGLDFNFNDTTKSVISNSFVPHEILY